MRLTLGLAAMTARQCATLWSSGHGGDVWRKEEVSTCESQEVSEMLLLSKNPREILRPQTPLSYPSKKKTAQSDVPAETALKSALKKTQ
jgi:hypothetical protein